MKLAAAGIGYRRPLAAPVLRQHQVAVRGLASTEAGEQQSDE
jgi:hypothetical protein